MVRMTHGAGAARFFTPLPDAEHCAVELPLKSRRRNTMRLDPQLTEKLQQRNEQQPSLVVERKRQPRASAPQELSDEHLEGVIGGTGVTMVGPAGLHRLRRGDPDEPGWIRAAGEETAMVKPEADKGLQRIHCKPLKIVVGAAGFELATLWSQTRCATRLRYAPTSARNYTTRLPSPGRKPRSSGI